MLGQYRRGDPEQSKHPRNLNALDQYLNTKSVRTLCTQKQQLKGSPQKQI